MQLMPLWLPFKMFAGINRFVGHIKVFELMEGQNFKSNNLSRDTVHISNDERTKLDLETIQRVWGRYKWVLPLF